MTVINPNSVAGINSITVQTGEALSVHKADGTLIKTIVSASGISTFSSISVGSATTANNADKSINIGLGASISSHANNTLSLGTGGDEALRVDSGQRILAGSTSARTNMKDFINDNVTPTFQFETANTDSKKDMLLMYGRNNATGANLIFGKHRTATVGGNGIAQDGDKLGGVVFTASDGATFRPSAAMHAFSNGTVATQDTPGALVFYTTPASSSTLVERLRINASGDVGIGTDTMNAPLTVVNNDNAGYIASFRQKHASNSAQIIIDSPADNNVRPSSIDLANAGTVKWSLGQAYSSTSSGAFHIANSALSANENGSKLIITTSGNTGIGTINPSKTLTIFGTSSSSFRISKSGVLAYDHTFDGSTYTIANNNGSAGIPILIGTKTAGGESVRITSGGKVGIGFTFNYTMNSSSTDLVIGDGGGGRGITLWTASGADNQTISFQTNETLSRAEGEIKYGPTGTTTTADRNAMMFRTNSGERMRIDSGGRVIIGATSSIVDSHELQVVQSNLPGSIALARNDSTVSAGAGLGQIVAYGNDNDGTYQECGGITFEADKNHGTNDKPTRIRFHTTADGGNSMTDRMQIEETGQLIVYGGGTRYDGWAGGTPLNVGSIAMINTGSADTNNWAWGLRGNSGDTQWCLERIKDTTSFADSNIRFRVYENGNYLFAGSDQSDRDIKENIVGITTTGSLNNIKQLLPRTYNFKSSEGYPTTTRSGFIAQEVAAVIPSIVNGTDGQKNMGIDYNGLVAHLVNAIKELEARVATLEGG